MSVLANSPVLSVSKSGNRFRVSFQIIKPMMAIAATPPATERPIIVPMLTPESLSGFLVADWAADDAGS